MSARLFWPLFVVLAVWLQFLFPGMDFFAAGIILSLQRCKPRTVALLLAVSILIQEGAGPLAFGASVLRYGFLAGVYLAGKRLFQAQSPAFILLLGFALALLHFVILKTMTSLQTWVVLDQRIVLESMAMFVVFLVEWLLLSRIYNTLLPHASRY